MGLDMYVTGKRYLWDFGENNDSQIADSIGQMFPEIAGKRVKQVEVEFMYWRKANAIHRWFVNNVQDGIDECQESCIERDQLLELQSVCARVMEDRSLAPTLLPAQSGFFFGSTEYDDWYFDDVNRTLQWLNGMFIKDALDEKLRKWEFYYRASW